MTEPWAQDLEWTGDFNHPITDRAITRSRCFAFLWCQQHMRWALSTTPPQD